MEIDTTFFNDIRNGDSDQFVSSRDSGRKYVIRLYIEEDDEGPYLTGNTFRYIGAGSPVLDKRYLSVTVTNKRPGDVVDTILDYEDEIVSALQTDPSSLGFGDVDPAHTTSGTVNRAIREDCRDVMTQQDFLNWYAHGPNRLGEDAIDWVLENGTIDGFMEDLKDSIGNEVVVPSIDVEYEIKFEVEDRLSSPEDYSVDEITSAVAVNDKLDLCFDTEKAIEYASEKIGLALDKASEALNR